MANHDEGHEERKKYELRHHKGVVESNLPAEVTDSIVEILKRESLGR